MPTPRKLNPEQERQVCLAYLCAVDMESISQQWQVCEKTIHSNIVGERSLKWNDPLVELYRSTNSLNRERNAAHLILAFNDKKDIPNGDLIDLQREKPIYKIVKSKVYDPHLNEIIQQTALNRYLSTQITGLELLLSAINPAWRTPEGIISPLFLETLREEYTGGAEFSMDRAGEKVTSYVLGKVKQGALAMTSPKIKFIQEVLSVLTEREQYTLSLLYGFSDEKKNLEQAGEMLGVTRGRVQQIKVEALHKLSHPSRIKKLEYVAGLRVMKEMVEYQAKLQDEQEKARWRKELYPEIRAEILAEVEIKKDHIKNYEIIPSNSKYDGRSIAELELSPRIQNCLADNGIVTIGQLRQKSKASLFKINQFHRRSFKAVSEALAPLGIELKED